MVPNEESEIKKTIKKLQSCKGDYRIIDQELRNKRLNWVKENQDILKSLEGSDVKKAYTLIIIKYLKLKPEEVPIVYEDNKKIVLHSYNFCPVLKACEKLGLDTRKVCKEAYEASVQEMISLINPKLRFSRNYDKIRPYSQYCEESIELID